MLEYTHHALRIQNILSIKRKKLKSVKMLEYGKILQKKGFINEVGRFIQETGDGEWV